MAGFSPHWSVLVKGRPVASSNFTLAMVHYKWLHNLMVMLGMPITTNSIVTTVYKSITIPCSRLVSAYTSKDKFVGRTLGWYDFTYKNENEHFIFDKSCHFWLKRPLVALAVCTRRRGWAQDLGHCIASHHPPTSLFCSQSCMQASYIVMLLVNHRSGQGSVVT